jgi:hypothetical protein
LVVGVEQQFSPWIESKGQCLFFQGQRSGRMETGGVVKTN